MQLPRGFTAVSETLRDIVEDLEPGVHQFWPIEITTPDGPYPGKYFGLAIGRSIKSFSEDDTDPSALLRGGAVPMITAISSLYHELAFRRDDRGAPALAASLQGRVVTGQPLQLRSHR